jgi:hypothetical protein
MPVTWKDSEVINLEAPCFCAANNLTLHFGGSGITSRRATAFVRHGRLLLALARRHFPAAVNLQPRSDLAELRDGEDQSSRSWDMQTCWGHTVNLPFSDYITVITLPHIFSHSQTIVRRTVYNYTHSSF